MAELSKIELDALNAAAKRAKVRLEWAESGVQELIVKLRDAKAAFAQAQDEFTALEKYLDG